MRGHSILVLSLLLLTACATTVPEPIRTEPPVAIDLEQVRSNTAAYTGQQVRWGGTIANVENRAKETLVDIVARPLNRSGRPRETDTSLGRFIARVPGFLDPAVYREGREVTVVGSIDGTLTRPIGQHPYRYVVVNADTVHLWEKRPEPHARYRDPYYDPFWYDPFWSWRPNPWYGPYPFWY